MWLINSSTYQLEEFWDERKIKYAILSHRWQDEEVSFRDMQDLAVATKRKGFAKIKKSCELALKEEDKCQYVWIDTCCINKESSADLSEAINSMFRWYEASAVCYAHLLDVQADVSGQIAVEQQIEDSVLFKRGWTLQELLAPSKVRFYNHHWITLGTKQTLAELLTKATGIDESILSGRVPISNRSVAQRMSWASKRKTTRKEDRAYCLLGIFDVNMPLLYGEGGKKAFLRLQEEIIKQSDDHTIFAWPIHRSNQPGLLADKPKAFAQCQLTEALNVRQGRAPYSMTNRGLSIKLLAIPYTVDTYLVRLDCAEGSSPREGAPLGNFRLGIFLRRLTEDDQFARVVYEGKTFVQLHASAWNMKMIKQAFHGAASPSRPVRPVERIEINVRQYSVYFTTPNVDDECINGFRIATNELFERTKNGADAFRVTAFGWDPHTHIMTMKPGEFGNTGTLDISAQSLKVKLLKLGFDFSFNPICFVAANGGMTAKGHFRDRNGLINYGTEAQQAQWSADEHMQFQSIHERGPFDTMAWSEVQQGGLAMELKQHEGLWALKGDRINGLNVRLGDLGTLWITRGRFEGKVVWDVYLGMKKPKEGALRKLFK